MFRVLPRPVGHAKFASCVAFVAQKKQVEGGGALFSSFFFLALFVGIESRSFEM